MRGLADPQSDEEQTEMCDHVQALQQRQRERLCVYIFHQRETTKRQCVCVCVCTCKSMLREIRGPREREISVCIYICTKETQRQRERERERPRDHIPQKDNRQRPWPRALRQRLISVPPTTSSVGMGSRARSSASSSAGRYFRWSSDELCGNKRTTFASTKVGPSPCRARAMAF